MTHEWAYAAAGLLLALGAPAGLLALRVLQGAASGGLRAAVAADLAAFVYVTVSTMVVFAAFGLALGRQADEMARRLDTDPLTGVLTRRSFVERLDREHARALRYPRPIAVLMLDVDRLKDINDRGGHAAGDAALRRMAAAIASGLRAADTAGRIGGDEFAVMAPEADAAAALTLAERIRSTAERTDAPAETLATVSIGVAAAAAGEEWTPAGLLDRADRALYGAKTRGRNRVVLDKEVVA